VAPIGRIEGYAIVSADGMIAGRDGVMPPGLIVPADQVFFERALDDADIVLHGRLSQESHPRSAERRRIIVTRAVPGVSNDPANAKIVLWNPAGASLDEAVVKFHIVNAIIGVVGGSEVFGLFLPLYDVFYLSRVPDLTLPGGRPVFPGVPRSTPEEMLQTHGLHQTERTLLDAARKVDLVTWRRSAV
jgi:dihydrofolate reductase